MGRQKGGTSKKVTVRVSVNALQNVDEITGYIALVAGQPLNAVWVGDKLFATFDRLRLNLSRSVAIFPPIEKFTGR